jgi:hypothetical protein
VAIICKSVVHQQRRGKEHETRKTWKRRKAIMVGGWIATYSGKSKERKTGGACKKAGNRARRVKMCNWETTRSFVEWKWYQCPNS